MTEDMNPMIRIAEALEKIAAHLDDKKFGVFMDTHEGSSNGMLFMGDKGTMATVNGDPVIVIADGKK